MGRDHRGERRAAAVVRIGVVAALREEVGEAEEIRFPRRLARAVVGVEHLGAVVALQERPRRRVVEEPAGEIRVVLLPGRPEPGHFVGNIGRVPVLRDRVRDGACRSALLCSTREGLRLAERDQQRDRAGCVFRRIPHEREQGLDALGRRSLTRRGDTRKSFSVERELIEQLPEMRLGRVARPALQELPGRVLACKGRQMLPALRQIERQQPKTGQEDMRRAAVRVQADGVLVDAVWLRRNPTAPPPVGHEAAARPRGRASSAPAAPAASRPGRRGSLIAARVAPAAPRPRRTGAPRPKPGSAPRGLPPSRPSS